MICFRCLCVLVSLANAVPAFSLYSAPGIHEYPLETNDYQFPFEGYGNYEANHVKEISVRAPPEATGCAGSLCELAVDLFIPISAATGSAKVSDANSGASLAHFGTASSIRSDDEAQGSDARVPSSTTSSHPSLAARPPLSSSGQHSPSDQHYPGGQHYNLNARADSQQDAAAMEDGPQVTTAASGHKQPATVASSSNSSNHMYSTSNHEPFSTVAGASTQEQFPLAVLSPGFLLSRAYYELYARHLASWGVLVLSWNPTREGALSPLSHATHGRIARWLVDWAISEAMRGPSMPLGGSLAGDATRWEPTTTPIRGADSSSSSGAHTLGMGVVSNEGGSNGRSGAASPLFGLLEGASAASPSSGASRAGVGGPAGGVVDSTQRAPAVWLTNAVERQTAGSGQRMPQDQGHRVAGFQQGVGSYGRHAMWRLGVVDDDGMDGIAHDGDVGAGAQPEERAKPRDDGNRLRPEPGSGVGGIPAAADGAVGQDGWQGLAERARDLSTSTMKWAIAHMRRLARWAARPFFVPACLRRGNGGQARLMRASSGSQAVCGSTEGNQVPEARPALSQSSPSSNGCLEQGCQREAARAHKGATASPRRKPLGSGRGDGAGAGPLPAIAPVELPRVIMAGHSLGAKASLLAAELDLGWGSRHVVGVVGIAPVDCPPPCKDFTDDNPSAVQGMTRDTAPAAWVSSALGGQAKGPCARSRSCFCDACEPARCNASLFFEASAKQAAARRLPDGPELTLNYPASTQSGGPGESKNLQADGPPVTAQGVKLSKNQRYYWAGGAGVSSKGIAWQVIVNDVGHVDFCESPSWSTRALCVGGPPAKRSVAQQLASTVLVSWAMYVLDHVPERDFGCAYVLRWSAVQASRGLASYFAQGVDKCPAVA